MKKDSSVYNLDCAFGLIHVVYKFILTKLNFITKIFWKKVHYLPRQGITDERIWLMILLATGMLFWSVSWSFQSNNLSRHTNKMNLIQIKPPPLSYKEHQIQCLIIWFLNCRCTICNTHIFRWDSFWSVQILMANTF